MKLVIALGGNMISDASNKSEKFIDQRQRVTNSAKIITDIIEKGHSVIITHGNGPQVGSLLLQQQSSVNGAVELPLQILGALTQGQIGLLLQHALLNEFRERGIDTKAVIIPTSVIVDENDPGFNNPTKPVGPFYTDEEFEKLDKKPGFHYSRTVEGYRRVVPSPVPIDILEIEVIRELSSEYVVIAGGGGGTPTVQTASGLQIQDAVIDKDLASALIAQKLHADLFMILTNVDGVYRDFNGPGRELISRMSKKEAKKLIESGEVSKGSMEPKVRAAMHFEGPVVITSPSQAIAALDGSAGTRITNE